jgi:hypothetical protein
MLDSSYVDLPAELFAWFALAAGDRAEDEQGFFA